jgi:hypothetical protein
MPGQEDHGAHLVLAADFSRPAYEISEHRLDPHRRHFESCGGEMDVQFLPTTLKFELRFA